MVAVDFGIMGRLGPKERRFLAEILHGLITRDYRRTAAVHFDAGYVPPHHSVEVFAQAMRAIGEPIHGRTASEISMADLLGQLFAYTEVFDMQTRPELLLLQKTMVVVEGVARALDPALNIWTAAEPIAKAWIEANAGVAGRLREAGEGAEVVGQVMAEVPRLLEQAERTALALADMARGGLRLDDDTLERLAAAQAHHNRWTRWALWVGALALAAMAVVVDPAGGLEIAVAGGENRVRRVKTPAVRYYALCADARPALNIDLQEACCSVRRRRKRSECRRAQRSNSQNVRHSAEQGLGRPGLWLRFGPTRQRVSGSGILERAGLRYRRLRRASPSYRCGPLPVRIDRWRRADVGAALASQ